MNYLETKNLIIQATKAALGEEAPENWDFLTEEYLLEEAIEENEKDITSNEPGILASVYGHDAYLNHSDNHWYYKRNMNNSGPSGGCGNDKRKWRCSARRAGSCSRHDIKYQFYK